MAGYGHLFLVHKLVCVHVFVGVVLPSRAYRAEQCVVNSVDKLSVDS